YGSAAPPCLRSVPTRRSSDLIGISLYPADGPGPDQLLKCADLALYRAKERGRDRIQLYNPALNLRVFEQMVLEQRLRQAIEQRQDRKSTRLNSSHVKISYAVF